MQSNSTLEQKLNYWAKKALENGRRQGLANNRDFLKTLRTAKMCKNLSYLRNLARVLEARIPVVGDFIPLSGPIEGKIKVGEDLMSGYGVSIDPDDLHGLIVGMNRQGKTTLLYMITEAAMNLGIKVTAFDLKKDMRHLIKKRADIYPLNLKDISLNILFEGPYSTWKDSLNYALNSMRLFCQAKGLGDISENECIHTVKALFLDFKVKKRLPTIQDLIGKFYARLKREKINPASPEGRSINRIIIRLKAFADALPVNCSQGVPLLDVFNSNVAIEYHDTDPKHAKLMAVSLFNWLYHHKLNSPQTQRGKEITNLFCYDEGGELLHVLDERNQFKGLDAWMRMLPKAKELGIVAIVANHNALISQGIRDNSTMLVGFKLVETWQCRYMAEMLGLPNRLIGSFRDLKPRQAIVRLTEKWPEPVLVQFDRYELEKDVTNEQAMEHSSDFLEGLKEGVVEGPQRNPNVKTNESAQGKGRNKHDGRASISSEGELLLRHISDEPLMNRKERSKALGKGSKWMQKHSQELVDAGMMTAVVGNQGGKGGRFTLFQPTPAGVNYLRDLRIDARLPKRDLCHRYLLTKLYRHIKSQGIEVEFTPTVEGGLKPDLLLHIGDRRIPAELQASGKASDAVEHVRQLLKGFDLIFLVVTSGKLNEEIKRACSGCFSASDLDKIRFFSYREMMSFDSPRLLSLGAA